MSITITVRIPRELKEKVNRYRIKVSEVVRKALEKEVEKKELEEAAAAAKELGELLARIPNEEIVKTIKEARRTR